MARPAGVNIVAGIVMVLVCAALLVFSGKGGSDVRNAQTRTLAPAALGNAGRSQPQPQPQLASPLDAAAKDAATPVPGTGFSETRSQTGTAAAAASAGSSGRITVTEIHLGRQRMHKPPYALRRQPGLFPGTEGMGPHAEHTGQRLYEAREHVGVWARPPALNQRVPFPIPHAQRFPQCLSHNTDLCPPPTPTHQPLICCLCLLPCAKAVVQGAAAVEPAGPRPVVQTSESCNQVQMANVKRVFGSVKAGSSCPTQEYVDIIRRATPDAASKPLTFINVGANKGYELADWMSAWEPDLGITMTRLRAVLLERAAEGLGQGMVQHKKDVTMCGPCEECAEVPPTVGPALSSRPAHTHIVHLLEPSSSNMFLLKAVQKHVANVLPIHLHQVAASNTSGTIKFLDCGLGCEFGHKRHNDDSNRNDFTTVQSTTLADFVTEHNIAGQIDFVCIGRYGGGGVGS